MQGVKNWLKSGDHMALYRSPFLNRQISDLAPGNSRNHIRESKERKGIIPLPTFWNLFVKGDVLGAVQSSDSFVDHDTAAYLATSKQRTKDGPRFVLCITAPQAFR
jgi:hypothetical protein